MRARRRAIPPAPLPVPQQTPREAWDALLASLPIDAEQRRSLTAAADDLALEAASRVARVASQHAEQARSAAIAHTIALEHAVGHTEGVIARESHARWTRTRGEP